MEVPRCGREELGGRALLGRWTGRHVDNAVCAAYCGGKALTGDHVDARGAGNGDFDALVAVLDPDVVVRSDGGNLPTGAAAILHGAAAVAAQALTYARLAPFVRPAIVNGAAGVVVAPGGKPFSVMAFTIRHDRIVAIDALSDQTRLAQLDLAVLDDQQN
jgi:RNA polymerase sigma-70 factor (ECF subfamily)